MDRERTPALARVCVLTAEGRGAIAVLRVWGERALMVVDSVFRPARGGRLAKSAPGHPRLGRIGAGLGDEVVAIVSEGESPDVEIQCHGGPAPLALVIEALKAVGAERRQPVAWVRRGSRSAVAAEAEVDLARATTVRSAEILLEQEQGALEQEIRRSIARVDDDPSRDLDALKCLIARSEIGLRLVSGWRVVLAGRPNVGKSRLLNALAGYDRAIVDPSPGTTRDVVSLRTALDGWPVELSDTAGLRATDDSIESSGIALARDHQRAADLVILVLDRSEPLSALDESLMSSAVGPTLTVANKADLAAAWQPADTAVLTVSADRGDGIELLGLAIARRLVLDPPAPGAGVPFRPAHVRHLREAHARLQSGDHASAIRALEALLAPLPV